MSEDYTIAIILWWNDAAQKGMTMDENGTAYAFDARNLDEQLSETGCHEGHIVAMEVNYRNGYGLARKLHCPTREEAVEHGDILEAVYQKNALEQELRKAERRGYVNSRGQRGTSLFVR